jgi:hypothetical protein
MEQFEAVVQDPFEAVPRILEIARKQGAVLASLRVDARAEAEVVVFAALRFGSADLARVFVSKVRALVGVVSAELLPRGQENRTQAQENPIASGARICA